MKYSKHGQVHTWTQCMDRFLRLLFVSRAATAICIQTLMTRVRIRSKTARTPGAARYEAAHRLREENHIDLLKPLKFVVFEVKMKIKPQHPNTRCERKHFESVFFFPSCSLFHPEVCSCSWRSSTRGSWSPKTRSPGLW